MATRDLHDTIPLPVHPGHAYCDVLMKYLYRGLGPAGKKNETYQMLLKWHPVVLKRGGHASIMRAISEVNQAL